MRKYKQIVPVLLLTGLIFSACSKEKSFSEPGTLPPDDSIPSGSVTDAVKDTTIAYAHDIYLWYNQIPASFNPRQYADPNAIMEAIRQYSQEPGFSQPVDRWSFAVKQSVWDDVSSGIMEDFGIDVFFLQQGDLRVRAVEKKSPAGLAGVRRGWRITGINGNTNITTGNANFIVDNIYFKPSTVVSFQKPDGTTVDITLNASSYNSDPVFLDSVYTAGNKKVGYLVFNSFLGDTNQIFDSFSRIFNNFSQEGVNEVIVDLRYNGGGYVHVQDKLANYLVNSGGNGNIMMNQEFNDKYSQLNESTRFQKIGNLELSRIFFIVSGSTASASELLINNLSTFLDVKIVGPEPSYGKPVGYFPIPVGDWYIFPVAFRSTNSAGDGNYFDGFSPDKQTADGIDKDWGDISESSLASIMTYIGTGNFGFMPEIPGVRAGANTRDNQVRESNRKLEAHEFKGMIDVRRRF